MKRVLGVLLALGGAVVIYLGQRLSGFTILGLLLAFVGLALLYQAPSQDQVNREISTRAADLQPGDVIPDGVVVNVELVGGRVFVLLREGEMYWANPDDQIQRK